MKMTAYILSAAFLSVSIGVSAAACEWHSGGNGPFQSRWAGYIADQTPIEEDGSLQTEDGYQPPVKVKKKPVFSKAASRASNIAKARVERTVKADVETSEAKAKDDAPATKTASR